MLLTERVMKQGRPIDLSAAQRTELERRTRSQTLDARSVRRARIVLLAADGVGHHEIARRLQSDRSQVIAWRNRFAQGGIAAIESDLPRSGRKPTGDCAPEHADHARGRPPLEHTQAGRPTRRLGHDGAQGSAGQWPEAALGRDLQGVARPEVHRDFELPAYGAPHAAFSRSAVPLPAPNRCRWSRTDRPRHCARRAAARGCARAVGARRCRRR